MRAKSLLILLGLALAVMTSVWLGNGLYVSYKGYPEPEKLILVQRGSQVSQIAQLLQSQGIIRSAGLFAAYVRLRHSRSLKAGEYRFDQPLNLAEVASKLARGDIYYHRVTIPEGLTFEEIIGQLTRQGFGERRRFVEIARHPGLMRDLDPEALDLEGYLFPDTYFLTRGSGEAEIIQMMVATFRRAWTQERHRRAESLGLTARQVVTLASLVEKETSLAQERRLVSAVFHNRLRQKIPLACDPTIIYAVTRVKPFDGIIHQSDLTIDSPYNTYLYPGLPPGPIANPGLHSIDAALYPAEVDYLYFVSRNDGTHEFSNRYPDHSRAVRRYQRTTQ